MYKISLLVLAISSPIYSALGPIMQCAKRLPGVVSIGLVQQPCGLVQRKRMLSNTKGSAWYDRYYLDSVKSILEKEVGYDFNGQSVKRELSQEQRAKILKKLMVHINRGENYDFYFRTGGVDNGWHYCGPDNDGSREMRFSELIKKKDWTHGKFIDLPRYFKAVYFMRSEEAAASAKRVARLTIQTIMKEYGITAEEVDFVPEAEPASSRVQEAD